jgi:hypothetical protein
MRPFNLGDDCGQSSSHAPMFFSQDLGQENILTGGNQDFVTQYRPPAHALNISTRMQVDTGSNVLIGGFIITGNTPKNIKASWGSELISYRY